MTYDVKIMQRPPCGLLNLRGAGLVCQRYDEVLGFKLPHAPNTTTGNKDIIAMWLGPDEWLIKTEDGQQRRIIGNGGYRISRQGIMSTPMALSSHELK